MNKQQTIPQAVAETPEQAIARLTAENEALKANQKVARALSCKVSEKGAVSVYGLGRFPVTLYKSQWIQLFGAGEMIGQFIQDNDQHLTSKEDKAKTQAA